MNQLAYHYVCSFLRECSPRQCLMTCTLLSIVCVSVLFLFTHAHTHTHTHHQGFLQRRRCLLVCQQAGLERASRQALSLSGLCYRRGNSVALIKKPVLTREASACSKPTGTSHHLHRASREPKGCVDWD